MAATDRCSLCDRAIVDATLPNGIGCFDCKSVYCVDCLYSASQVRQMAQRMDQDMTRLHGPNWKEQLRKLGGQVGYCLSRNFGPVPCPVCSGKAKPHAASATKKSWLQFWK